MTSGNTYVVVVSIVDGERGIIRGQPFSLLTSIANVNSVGKSVGEFVKCRATSDVKLGDGSTSTEASSCYLFEEDRAVAERKSVPHDIYLGLFAY